MYIYIYIKSNVYWLPFNEVYFESVQQRKHKICSKLQTYHCFCSHNKQQTITNLPVWT